MKVSKLLQQSYTDYKGTTTPADIPAAGHIRLYNKAPGILYTQNDSGVEVPLLTGSIQQDNVILSTAAVLVDSVPLSAIKTMKYIVYFETGSKYSSNELLVINRNGVIEYSMYGIVGDDVDVVIDISSDMSNINMVITNNELVTVTSSILRYSILS